MFEFIIILVIALLGLILVLLVRTFSLTSRQVATQPARSTIDAQAAVRRWPALYNSKPSPIKTRLNSTVRLHRSASLPGERLPCVHVHLSRE